MLFLKIKDGLSSESSIHNNPAPVNGKSSKISYFKNEQVDMLIKNKSSKFLHAQYK